MLLHTYAIKPDASQGVATGLRIVAVPHGRLDYVAYARPRRYSVHNEALKELGVESIGLGGRDPDGKLWVVVPEGHNQIANDSVVQAHLAWIKENLYTRTAAAQQRRRKVR